MKNNIFSELNIGDQAGFEVTITQKQVDDFIALIGDDNLLHTSEEHARKKGFKKTIVHGMLLASYFSKLVGKYFLKDDNLYLTQDLQFKNPVYVGEAITIKGEIITKSNSMKLLEIKTTIINQDNEESVRGIAKVKLI